MRLFVWSTRGAAARRFLALCLALAPAFARAAEPAASGRVEAVRFTSDHKLLCRNTTDLLAGGERYPDVAWTRAPRTNAPITHTGGDSRVRAELRLSLAGAAGDVPYLLRGTSDEPALCFRAEGTLPAGDEVSVEVEASGPLGRPVRTLRAKVAWSLTLHPGTKRQQTLALGQTGPHVVHVTLGTPRCTDEARSVVTDARMALAVERVAAAMKAAGPDASAPKIVHELMKQNGDDYLPTRHYSKEKAWKVPESWRMTPKGASCVSIVEFVGLLCKMIGLEGELETTAFCATAAEPHAAVRGGLGDPPVKKKGPGNETWQLFLVDETNTNFGQAGGVGGMNYYEAALEYHHDGKTYYYPGGTDRVYDAPDKVLKVFRTLAWATWDENLQDWVVREVVATYVRQGERRPRSVRLP